MVSTTTTKSRKFTSTSRILGISETGTTSTSGAIPTEFAPKSLSELAEVLEKARGLKRERERAFTLMPTQVKITITELPKLLEIVPRNWPILLIGPPGVGKTKGAQTYVQEEAKKEGRILVPVHLLTEEAIAKMIEKIRKEPWKYYLYLYLHGGRLTEEYQGIPRIGFEAESLVKPLAAFLSALASAATGKKVEIKPEELMKLSSEYLSKYGVSWKVPMKIAPFIVQLGEEAIESGLAQKVLQFLEYEVPPKELEEELKKYLPMGTIIIDEATQAPPFFVETMVQGLTGEYTWGEHLISPLTRLILAANPPEYNIEAKYFPEPVLRRVLPVEVLPPTHYEMWYYIREKYPEAPSEILAFLAARPSLRLASSEEIKQRVKKFQPYPTPAGWARLAGLAASILRGERTISPEWMYRITAWLLGEDVAKALYDFMLIKTPPPEEILKKPELFFKRLEEEKEEAARELARLKMIIELIDYLRANKHRAAELVDALSNLLREMIARNMGQSILDLVFFTASLNDRELTQILWQAFIKAITGTTQITPENMQKVSEIWMNLLKVLTPT